MDEADLDPKGQESYDGLLMPPDNFRRASPLYNRVALKPWHEALAEYIIMNPSATKKQAAEFFGVTPQAVILVTGSDMFKHFLARRMQSLRDRVDQTAMDRLQGKVAVVAEQALDVLAEKIELERSNLGIDAVRESAEMALKALGFGTAKSSPQSPVTVQFNITSADLASARELMRGASVPLIEAPVEALPAAE